MIAAGKFACVLSMRFHVLPWPPVRATDLAEQAAAAAALDVAEPPLAAGDDTPSTAAQIPGLRDALAAVAAARFDRAADLLVAYAASDPRAPESGWALRRAYHYWRALGRDANAAAVVRTYETHHAAREPRAAAE